MKRLIPLCIFGAAISCGLLTTSCDNNARLAGQLTGVWAGTPESFTDRSAITASIIDTFDFQPDTCVGRGCHAGPLLITGMVTTSTQVVGDNSLIEPINISTAAHTTISGSWTVIDDDELLIRLNPATLKVSIDPRDVAVNTNPYNPEAVKTDSLAPALSASIEAGLRHALLSRYASMTHFDDVEIKGQLMKYELNDIDHTLTRQM
ncbi:MAG: hypothetical protein K2L91_01015 [Duncaniella sp.]|nr:hypothetical protein [Duncaniella sp.]MDE5918883.1 hypothetical protein [Duncaniella sp.]MDE6327088.1 hypothetical protein [Duncaniella sp.]MDE6764930.1 hypothetical protein [Duncaniella sp.]